MKTMKKIAALLLAVLMLMSLATTAFAEGEGGESETPAEPAVHNSITINNAKVGETYKLYKLFDLKVNSETEPTAYSYTINSDWADFFAAAEGENPAGEGRQYITVNDAGYVTGISDAAGLAKVAAVAAAGKTAKDSETASAASFTFADLENGYWLVTSTLGTFAMTDTTPDKKAVNIDEKNPENTIAKEVKEDSTGTYGENNDAQVGDTVEFKSVVKIVKGTRNVVVHDKMDSGLTYTAGSVAIEGLTKGAEYTVSESPADGDTFDITFTQSWIDGLDFGTAGYKEYTITYTATLNENAIVKDENGVAIVDQNNKTYVSFGDATKSTEDTTITTTHKFSVYKHAANATDNLAGATFELKKNGTAVKLIKLDDNNYRVAMAEETGAVATFTTVENGDIVIWGVDADNDYALNETAAPAGYNKLKEEKAVTVDAGNNTRVDIENNAGTELPSTGGMGTTLFYIVGGFLVVAAVVLLVTKKRMAAE